MSNPNISIIPSIDSTVDLTNNNNTKNIIKRKGFTQEFVQFSKARIARLKITILGDYDYKPQNSFKQPYKQKILAYLKTKYMTLVAQLDEAKVRRFTNYNIDYGTNIQYRDLKHMKQVLLKMRTQIDAAEDSMAKSDIGFKDVKANFLNQTAFQFDRQKKSSICWGLLTASLICSTIYRRGNEIRKMAVFFAFGHLFGQVAYHWNLDKYFDTVYTIFQEDAIAFVESEERQRLKQESKGQKIQIIED